jgi:PAS domain S-box-containing protein
VWLATPEGIFPEELTPDLGLILDSLPDGVYGTDITGRTVLVNRAAARMLGYEPAELIGTVPHDVMHHSREDGTPFPPQACPLALAAAEARPCSITDDTFWRRDGSSFPVAYESQPMHRDGRVVGFLVTFRDISERRRNEERVRELLREQFAKARAEFQYAQLRDVLAQTPAVICVTRGSRHVIETINERFRDMVGERDVVGLTMREAFPEIDHRRLALMDLAYESGKAAHGKELPFLVDTAGGPEQRYYNYVWQPLRDESGFVYGLMTHAVDVTREVRARQQLEVQQRQATLTAEVAVAATKQMPLREMLQSCAESVVRHLDAAFARIWTLDQAGTLLQLEASAGQYTHLDGSHGRVPVGQYKIGLIAEERRPHVTNTVIGDPRVGDQDWARREGMRAFAGYPLMVGDDLVGVLALFARRTLDDHDRQALETVAQSVALGIQRRLTEDALHRRADALARTAAALRRTNSELDAFAYVASHDLRAPLRGIANLAQWIEEDLTASDGLKGETRDMLGLLRSRMHRMEALIDGILEYSRAGRITEQPADHDVRRLVAEAVELLDVPAHAEIVIDEALPTVHSAQLPLQQIFMNLIGNALKYNHSAAPRVWITSEDAGGYIRFSVRDNGPGIPAEYQTKIWGIFQTLEARDKVEATGIGLSLVKKLVEGQGGHAWVESPPGQGATFHFLWPKRAPAQTEIED